jgi:hypothetical protein
MGGLKACENRSSGADQCVGPAASCREMGDFVRIMENNLKRENSHPSRFAKTFCSDISLEPAAKSHCQAPARVIECFGNIVNLRTVEFNERGPRFLNSSPPSHLPILLRLCATTPRVTLNRCFFTSSMSGILPTSRQNLRCSFRTAIAGYRKVVRPGHTISNTITEPNEAQGAPVGESPIAPSHCPRLAAPPARGSIRLPRSDSR